MNDLKFYDFNFKLLHIEHDFSSVYWHIKFNGTGTFEAEFSALNPVCPICIENKFIIVCQGDFQAIITGKQIKNSKLTLTGRTVNFLLEKRTIEPFSTYKINISKDPVSIARYVVEKSCGDFITLGSKVTAQSSDEFWRNTMHPCIEVVCDCLDKENLGHNLFFDIKNKKFVFDIYKGVTRSIVLSDDNLNTYDSEYTHSLLDYATSGYYFKNLSFKGEWNPVSNTPSLTDGDSSNYSISYKVSEDGTKFGIDFKKGDYIICKTQSGKWEKSDETDGFWEYIEGTQKGIFRWDVSLSATGKNEAEKQLSQKKLTEKLSAKIRNLTFGKDFNLGDTVTVSLKTGGKNISFKQLISAVTIWYEKNNTSGIKPEFKEIT